MEVTAVTKDFMPYLSINILFSNKRSIQQAAIAAPKRLSIFTTVIPLAQLFNMVNKSP